MAEENVSGGANESEGDHDAKQSVQRRLEDVHRDVDFGIRFRLELDKTLLALAAAVFAFTVAFPPKLTHVDEARLLAYGWSALAVSMLGGFGEMHGWERFYLTYRDFEFFGKNGKDTRRVITRWRRVCRFLQVTGFIVGVIAIGSFVLSNFANMKTAG